MGMGTRYRYLNVYFCIVHVPLCAYKETGYDPGMTVDMYAVCACVCVRFCMEARFY